MLEPEQITMQLILHSGSARSLAYEAFDLAESGEYGAAREKLREAADEIRRAHGIQTNLIQSEAAGSSQPVSLLLVHGQDHLMTAMAEVNLIQRLIRVLEARRP